MSRSPGPKPPPDPKPHSLGPQLHISKSQKLVPQVPPVVNRHFVKPLGGFWTSSYAQSESEWGGKSEWVDAYQDMFGNSRGSVYDLNWFLLTPDPAARVLVIDSLNDLRRILRRHRQSFGPPRHTSWYSMFVFPDFEAISQEYDAMNLTSQGQWATRLSAPSLDGWDSESTLWFRWRFLDCVKITPSPL